MLNAPTIAALSTPQGESALALIRLSGPLCLSLSQTLFRIELPVQPRYSYLNTYRSVTGEELDEVLWCFFPTKSSFTGEAMLEIACHGNPLIIDSILEDLCARGCRLAEPGEFTRTAFLNNKLDLSQAEAIADLIHAKNEQALHAAKKQMGGALSKKINQVMDKLLQAIAEFEAYIDFSEEDLPAENLQASASALESIKEEIHTLIINHRYRKPLVNGLQISLIGAPNAGKSTLFNALLGEERALVSPEAGTTRDYIQAFISIGPYCVYLNDTAGLRETAHPIERAGIAKTLERIEESDFYVWLIDRSAPFIELDPEWIKQLDPKNTIILETKSDLPTVCQVPKNFECYPRLSLSLHDSKAIHSLRKDLEKAIQLSQLLPNPDTLIVNSRHAQALKVCYQYLEASLDLIQKKAPTELAVSELRLALDALGEILGRVDNEAMLDKLFASFCIGK